MKRIILFLSVVVLPFRLYAFIPEIKSYGSKDFNSNPICYDIARDHISGNIYFATEYSLIEYDGARWNNLNISSAVFACKFSNDGRLYVGGENEIGYFDKSGGKFNYISITKKQFRNFGRIKKIEVKANEVFFYTKDEVFCYYSKTGLLSSAKNSFNSDTHLIPAELFKNNRDKIFISCKIKNGCYAIGTKKEGIYIFTPDLQLKYHLTVEDGLLSNAITNLYEDQSGDLWVATHKGVSVIKLGLPYVYLEENQEIDGMGYCSLQMDTQIYLGTSNGLFITNLPLDRKQKITRIQNITNKVHCLYQDGPNIICCTETGLFVKKAGAAFFKVKGSDNIAWTVVRSATSADHFLVGTIDGIYLLTKAAGNYELGTKLSGFEESSRNILMIDRHLWVLHGLKGLYHLALNQNSTQVTSCVNVNTIMNVAPNYFHDLCRLQNNYFVSSYGGTYEIQGQKIVRSERFAAIADKIHRLRAVNDSIAFYKKMQKPVLIQFRSGVFQPLYDLSDMPVRLAGSAENICQLQHDYLIGTEEGFALFSGNNISYKIFPPLISAAVIHAKRDTSIYNFEKPVILSANENNISFQYSLPDYRNFSNKTFETSLQKENNAALTDLITADFKEYTNLAPGQYVFMVRIWQNNQWFTSQKIHFEIMAPWYMTIYAYCIYVFLACIIIVVLQKWFKASVKNIEQKLYLEKQEDIKQLQMLREKDILQQQLEKKEDELAFIAINYVQQKQALEKIRDKMNDTVLKFPENQKKDIQQIPQLLDELIAEETVGNWQDFQMHYDKANNNFFAKLKALDPDIDESTLLLCSYIIVNKNNQEIGELLHLAKESIAKRKYRLKKKWNLDEKTDLRAFLKSL